MVIEIKGYKVLIDDEDFELINKYKVDDARKGVSKQ